MKDFTLILAAVTVLCGIAWFWDFLKVRPLRNARILAAEKAAGGSLSKEEREKLEAGNWFVDLGRECFWVLLAVFLFRSFLFEPFRIPSESMMPTLLKGDFVAVEKYAYGIRNPFTGKVMIGTGSPSRGDIAVFRYPEDPDTAFIKRIIGLPGDTVSYDEAKNLTIKPADGSDPVTVPKEWTGIGEFSLAGHPLKRGTEDLLGVRHDILEAPDRTFPLFAYRKQDGMPEEPGRCLRECTLPWVTTVTTAATAGSGALSRRMTSSARPRSSGSASIQTAAACAALLKACASAGLVRFIRGRKSESKYESAG